MSATTGNGLSGPFLTLSEMVEGYLAAVLEPQSTLKTTAPICVRFGEFLKSVATTVAEKQPYLNRQ
jgi:hypothetical protein